jgi:hypothetical protein
MGTRAQRKAEAEQYGHVLIGSTMGQEYRLQLQLLCRIESPGDRWIPNQIKTNWLVTCEECRNAAGWIPLTGETA